MVVLHKGLVLVWRSKLTLVLPVLWRCFMCGEKCACKMG